MHTAPQVPGRGGEVARAAGSAATIQFKEAPFAVVKMPSGAAVGAWDFRE